MFGVNDPNRRWWLLAAMSGVLGLVVLDETVVGVALATMRADLAMSPVASHWVVNAYFLTLAGFVAVGGRLGDTFGHSMLFVLGVAIFGLASLAAGFAQTGAWLIAARAIQGLGAAIVFPASWAMMTGLFTPEQRGLAFGIQTTVGGMFMSLGPLVGGFFAETISWRWIFWINLPIVFCVALIVLAAATPPSRDGREPAAEDLRGLDYRGLVTLVTGLAALVIALMQGSEWGWRAPATLILFGGGLVLLLLFVFAEARTAGPLIEVGLLRIATFTGGNLVFFVFQFNKIAVFVFVPLYLQDVLHRSPIDAGLVLVIAVVPTLFTSILAGRSADRFGSRRPLLVGLLLNGAAVSLVGLATAFDTVHGSYTLIVAPLLVWGATLPFISVCPRRALMSAVPQPLLGQASGVNLTIQMLGGTVGVALCGSLLLATGTYGSVFLTTGALTFAALIAAWFTIERPAPHAAATK